MTTTSIRDRVFASIPGYDEAQSLVANAKRLRTIHEKPVTVPSETIKVREAVKSLIQDGTDVPFDIARTLLEAEQNERLNKLRDEAFVAVMQEAEGFMKYLEKGAQARAAQVLRDELADLVTEGRNQIALLDGARSPAQVITRGDEARNAWTALTELAARYDEIRSTQFELMRQGVPIENLVLMLTATGLYRNALDVSGYWLRRRLEAAQKSVGDSVGHIAWLRETPQTRMPLNADNKWWPDHTDQTTALVSILIESEPWIPDADVLMEAHGHASRATKDVRPQPFSNVPPDAEQTYAMEQYRRLTEDLDAIPEPPTDMTEHDLAAKSLERKLREENVKVRPATPSVRRID